MPEHPSDPQRHTPAPQPPPELAVDAGGDRTANSEGSTRARFVPKEIVLAAFRDAPHIDFTRFRDDLDSVADPFIDPER